MTTGRATVGVAIVTVAAKGGGKVALLAYWFKLPQLMEFEN